MGSSTQAVSDFSAVIQPEHNVEAWAALSHMVMQHHSHALWSGCDTTWKETCHEQTAFEMNECQHSYGKCIKAYQNLAPRSSTL